MKRFVAGTALLVLTATAQIAPAAADPAPSWHGPDCAAVSGDGAISYTRNEGRTIVPTTSDQQPVDYLFSLVALDKPDVLLGVDSHGRVQRSANAGCSWHVVAQVAGFDVPRLTPGVDGTAYLWNEHSAALARIVGTQVTTLPAVTDVDGAEVAALAVDRSLPRHLRAVLNDGTVLDSFDRGQSFTATAAAPESNLYLYDAAIDPADLDHIVLGTQSIGVFQSSDAGSSWTHATGFGSDRVNGFTVAISPVDPDVVWVQGLNLDENAAHAPSEGRHIYRSVDGGVTFAPAVDHVPGEVTLVNGTLLQPSPTDPGVLYFVFGMSYGGYGTDLFRFDAGTGSLQLRHNDHDDIDAIAFNPHNPKVMYLGFASEVLD